MSDPKDRRGAARFPVNAATHCGFALPVVDDYGPAKIQNISTEGIGMLLDRSVDAGTILVIGLTNKAQNFTKTAFVEVVHSTKTVGGAYLVGCEFLTSLTYDELRTFVM